MINLLLLPLLTGFQTGLWVRAMSMASPDSVPRIVDLAEELGVTDIYAQVVVGGYAYYRSELLPRSEYLAKNSAPDYDPLAELLRAASQKNITVHAWVNTLLIWSLDSAPDSLSHVQHCHPEWFLKDIFGRRAGQYTPMEWENLGLEGTYLDPANPDVRDQIAKICAEIAGKYAVCGVHLDFIRFPGIYWGLSAGNSTALLCGMDAEDVRWLTLVRYPRLDLFKRWLVYNYFLLSRQRSVDIEQLIRTVTDRIRSVKRDCIVSAAVAANPSRAIYQYGQAWPTWGRDLIDNIIVMSYTQDILLFKDFVDYTYLHQPRALMGIGLLWPGMEDEAWWEYQYVENSGGSGVCYFDFTSLDTMVDIQMLNGNITVNDESLYRDTTRFTLVNGVFNDPAPRLWVTAGQKPGFGNEAFDFADFLLSLSLTPQRDLARMNMTEDYFLTEIKSDVAAFEYLNSRISQAGQEFIEPPSREITYEFLDWDDHKGDSVGLVQAAEQLSVLSQRVTLYPVSMNALAKPVFEADLDERKIFLTRAGIFTYQVKSINEGGRKVKKTTVYPELEQVYRYWTVKSKFAMLMEQQ